MLFISLTSCAGMSDWSYKLPNEYEVWRINSNEVVIKYVGDETVASCIPSFVKEFAYDSRYICTRNVRLIDNNDIFDEEYYLLDTVNRERYGPFQTLEELKKKIDEYHITLERWYRTSPDPNLVEHNS